MPPKSRQAAGAKKVRRKEKKNIAQGEAHIKSTFNNTIVTITDPTGAVISWASAGTVGFKGSRKSTPFAAQMAAEAAGRRAMDHGMKKIDVFVKGPGSGREKAIRSLGAIGLEVGTIQDVTPTPHNGCRPTKRGRGRIKESEYLLQLREKQKARFTYGVLEKQFHNYYTEASRRQGKTGDNLLQLLECRLDNVVYRAGFARTRRHARQLVVHGHFKVNGQKVNIPSFQVTAHDVIDVKEKSLETTPFIVARETHGERVVPAWLEAIPSRMRILVHQLPVRAQIDIPVQEQLIVEYYSKK